MDKETIEVTAEIMAETEKAFLLNDGVTEAWLPKSQIEQLEEGSKGDTSLFLIPEWLALDKGFI